MSTIRRQSIISSGLVYFGFALGFLNTYLFTRARGGFTTEQYGLTQIFMAIGSMMYSVANLGSQAYIYKFYPYYKDNLPPEKNDMMTWALLTCVLGFGGVVLAGVAGKDFIIRIFGYNSPDLVKYYYWIFPFTFGLTLFSLLEAFAWQLKKSILTNFLKEVLFRIFTTTLLLLSFAGVLARFDIFIKIYAFLYLVLTLVLFVYLLARRELHFVFSPSRVTKRFIKKIRALALLVWGGGLVFSVSNYFAHLVIASVVPGGLAVVGIYSLALFIGSLMQAPQRVIVSASIAPLSQAWKEKDYGKINRIYHRSSINQLIFSVGMFVLIWINFKDGVSTFGLNPDYLAAQTIFLYVGLKLIIDMGTGLNTQIIGTSTFWRFDFFSGLILIGLTLPLNYVLAKKLGGIGPAMADLFTFAIYNGIRWLFLYRKFGMQPFTAKTLYTLLLGGTGYLIGYLLFDRYHGFWIMVLRSSVFLVFFAAGVLGLRLSEDVLPVWRTLLKRLESPAKTTGRKRRRYL